MASVLVGCGERESGKAPSSSSAETPPRAQDTKYQERLRAQVSEREVLLRAQQTVIRKMEAVAAKYNGDLKAAANDPEMISLIRRARELEVNFSSNRTHTAEIIRARATKSLSEKEVNK